MAPLELKLNDLADLLVGLTELGSLRGVGVLAACLVLAWGLARLIRGPRSAPDSILFGRRIFDGVLFPLLALALAFAAEVALAPFMKVAVFKLAVPMLISLVVIRLSVRVLSAAFPTTLWVRLVERSISWAAWIVVVLWLTGVLPFMLDALDDINWKFGVHRMSLRNVVEGTLTTGLVLVLVLWVASAIETKLLAGAIGSALSMRKIVANLVRSSLLLIGLLVALSAVGIDLTALSVLGGAMGVGLGFGLQKIAANYISGFVVLAERSIRIGDMVKVDNFEGRVADIRTRYTVIRALNGRESLVPNEMLITQRVENSSLADLKVLIVNPVQVAYGTDVRALQPKIAEVVGRVPRVITDPAPGAQLAEFAADGINLNVVFWIADPENGQGNVRSEVNLALLDLLNAEGIEIPFPQRVMHARPVPEPEPAVAGASPT